MEMLQMHLIAKYLKTFFNLIRKQGKHFRERNKNYLIDARTFFLHFYRVIEEIVRPKVDY